VYERGANPLDVVDALSATDHALTINPSHAPALFNRALALQQLGLLQEAIVAWKQFLSVDMTSPWTDEALRALRQLRVKVPSRSAQGDTLRHLEQPDQPQLTLDRVVRDHPRLARRACETTYLGNWGAALQKGDEITANSQLALVRNIASALQRTSGETLLFDAVAVIDEITTNAGQRTTLAEGCVQYSAGRRAFNQQNISEAEARFRDAERQFNRGHSPLVYLARYSIASSLYAQQRTGEAEAMLDELAAARFDQLGYHALAGQIGWERGLAKLVRGSFSAGRRVLADSRAEFSRVGELEAAAAMDEFMAENDDFSGDTEAAWKLRLTAFPVLSHAGEAARKVTAIDAASAAFIVRGEWERAVAILNIASQSAEEMHDPLRAAHALTDRSIAFAELGDLRRAEADLRQARRWCAMLRDESQTRLIKERGLLTEALIVRDPRKSIALLDRDLAQLLAAGRSLFAGRLLLERARLHREIAAPEASRADIEEAMRMLENQRATLTSVDSRALLASTAEALTNEAVRNAFDRRAPADAFTAIERWRGRALLDALERTDDREGAAAQPLTIQEISLALAPQAAIIEYALVDNRLIIFVVRRDRIFYFDRAVDASRIHSIAAAVSAATRRTDGYSDASLMESDAAFIAPLEEALRGIQVVVFIADPRLPLPFSALRDATTGESVGSRFATVVAPSATLAIHCSLAARQRRGNVIVAVAGDAFDPNAALGLRPLIHAAAESAAVSRLYARATLLTGASATKKAVAAAAAPANIFHFAGHAASIGSRAADSGLFLAHDRDSSIVTAAEISRWPLTETRLVFLSACRTGKPGTMGDGIENLASAFVVAGAPTVIAAAWDVDDQSVADVAIRFHRFCSAGEPIASSLRHACINRDHPQWPPMMIVGGLAELVKSRKGE